MARIPATRATILIATLIAAFGLAAGATAQGEEMVVTITEIQSRDYPRLSLFLAVADISGPVANLENDDFEIFADDAKRPIVPLAVEEAVLEGLRLVLVLDTSMPADDLERVKAVVTELTGTISPKDKVAIMAFGDDAELAHDFTNNRTELQTVIESLTPQGNQTAIHEAMLEASALLAEIPEGHHRAAVFITDSRDNTGRQSATQAVSQAQANRLPLYVAGFGDKVQAAHPLKAEVTLTGGQYFTLANVDELASTVKEIEKLLRQGYQLTFESDLRADGSAHELTVVVTHAGSEGQAGSNFTATPGTVVVEIPNISKNQMLAGKIELKPEVTAPTTLKTVTYLLDHQVLATLSEPPLTFDWDTTSFAPGNYTLVVRAVDNVGNEGQAEVAVTVAAPVAVTISSTKEVIEIGSMVAFQATVEATAQVSSVDLLLNNQLVAAKTEPPFRFTFDSSAYLPGNYVFVVRVEDSLGQTAQNSVSLNFISPPPPPPPLWQRILNDVRFRFSATLILAVISIVSIGIITILVLSLMGSGFRKRSRRTCRLEIVNTGNIQSRFRLQAKDTDGRLQFQFSLGKKPLLPLRAAQPRPVTTTPAGAIPMAVPSGSPGYTGQSGQTGSPSAPPPAQTKKGDGAQQVVAKAGEAHSQAYGCSYMIAELLETLGSLLPGSAGASARKASEQIYGGQMAVDRAVRTPTQTARTAQYLKYQVSEAVPSGSKGKSGAVYGSSAPYEGDSYAPTTQTTGEPTGVPTAYGPVSAGSPLAQPQAGYVSAPATNGHQQADSAWSQTPFIEPGDSLVLELLITPDKPFKKQTYDFTISSKPMDQDEAPLTTEHSTAQIKGLFWLWRFIPIFMVVVIMVGLIFGVFWLATWRLFGLDLLSLIFDQYLWS